MPNICEEVTLSITQIMNTYNIFTIELKHSCLQYLKYIKKNTNFISTHRLQLTLKITLYLLRIQNLNKNKTFIYLQLNYTQWQKNSRRKSIRRKYREKTIGVRCNLYEDSWAITPHLFWTQQLQRKEMTQIDHKSRFSKKQFSHSDLNRSLV